MKAALYEDRIKQIAFENACDCFIYGTSSKEWIDNHWNQDLPRKESEEIWSRAFWFVAEGRM